MESAGTHAQLGASRSILVEADESDASFLYLQPMVAVITNIDQDHMATYEHDFERVKRTFVEFVHRLPFYGTAVLCVDDDVIRGLLPDLARPMVTYGFADDADYQAQGLRSTGLTWHFDVVRPRPYGTLEIELAIPGHHNVQNALAAIAVATDEGLDDDAIVQGLAEFSGVGRRFQIFDDIRIDDVSVTLVDDYGHHPTEVRAVLDTARRVWPQRRLVMVYQPHRYTRTRDLYDDFVKVLSEVDALLLVDVYAAGEAPIAGADGKALCQGIRSRGNLNPVFANDPENAYQLLRSIVQENDVLLVQGAGNVNQVSNRLRGLGDA